MFEKILSITKNFAIVKISNNINDDILNYNVILEDKDKRILGEIDEVINDEEYAKAYLESNKTEGTPPFQAVNDKQAFTSARSET